MIIVWVKINMEKRLNNKVENYIKNFKDDVRNKIMNLDFKEEQSIPSLLEYIYDYNRLVVDKEDFVKRKRVKNSIPENNRCMAKRANGEQCTRRRKDMNTEFCGTHSKGAPHGLIDNNEKIMKTEHTLEVFAQDIKGIVYYIDHFHNVYNTEQIMSNLENPEIIGKWEKHGEMYSIPSLGLV